MASSAASSCAATKSRVYASPSGYPGAVSNSSTCAAPDRAAAARREGVRMTPPRSRLFVGGLAGGGRRLRFAGGAFLAGELLVALGFLLLLLRQLALALGEIVIGLGHGVLGTAKPLD